MDQNEFIREIEAHLKSLSRQIMRLDTTDAILKYLSEMLLKSLEADVVFIMAKKENMLELHSSLGMSNPAFKIVPINLDTISTEILYHSMKGDNEVYQDTLLELYIEKFGIKDWFSIPLRDQDSVLGICFVGFKYPRPLYSELKDSLDELGNYVAISINLIRKGEQRSLELLEFQAKNIERRNPFSLIEEIVNLAGKETQSKKLGIYLFNDDKSNLMLQKPSYGSGSLKQKIIATGSNYIKDLMPRVEEIGYYRITIPIVLNMEMLGVIFAQKEYSYFFNHEDYDRLKMYSNYFATIYENHLLSQSEQKHQFNLEMLLRIQQKLIKETVVNNDVATTNQMVGKLLNTNVILFDQYMNPIDIYTPKGVRIFRDKVTIAGQEIKNTINLNQKSFEMTVSGIHEFRVNAIDDGSEHYGFLAIDKVVFDLRDLETVALNILNNIYSVQFIKRQIEWSSKEEVKESYIHRLLSPKIEDLPSIIEFATSNQWDIYGAHYVLVISVNNHSNGFDDLLEIRSQFIRLQKLASLKYRKMITSRIDNQLVCFIPELTVKSDYWDEFQEFVENNLEADVYIGIGGITQGIVSYYEQYQKAVQTLNVLKESHDFENKRIACFEDLGSYALLKELEDLPATHLFIKNYLKEIYLLSKDQTINYYETLKAYVFNAGSIQDTANDLFLHRSTLTYRIDKVRDIVKVDIDDRQERFNYILAYKLVDLMGYQVFED